MTNPCGDCIRTFGRAMCDDGFCPYEDVPGEDPKDILGESKDFSKERGME